MWVLFGHAGLSVLLLTITLLQQLLVIGWFVDPTLLLRITAGVFLAGPFLGFGVLVTAPRNRFLSQGGRGEWVAPRVGKRIGRVAALILLIPLGLLIAVIDRDIQMMGAAIGVGAAALLTILAPWVVWYACWSNSTTNRFQAN